MNEQLIQLRELETQLHEVNQEFARAAQPLYRMTDLNEEQKVQLRKQLLAVQARWESVTQQIAQVLGTGSAPGVFRENTTKADCDEKH